MGFLGLPLEAWDRPNIGTDLRTLLQRGNEPGPYVLDGHSFGGLCVLTFAARYLEDMPARVLLDSTAPASKPEPDLARPTRANSDDTI
jgi:pimeloyl-ACP methyl ester carboxylesterase